MNQSLFNQKTANILVVDDTAANLRILMKILATKGYKVRPARDGYQALSIVKKVKIDLILLDIMMPEINGYEVCDRLKTDPETKHIPVIFISALNDILDKVKAFDIGAVDYIIKPFYKQEVIARVETHLNLQLLQQNLQSKNQELAAQNEKLSHTIKQLKTTQQELIRSEKMATLGQLIAGIAHEINTPLSAIRSCARNISNFLNQSLESLPQLFQFLTPEEWDNFLALLEESIQKNSRFSTREERQLKRVLRGKLEALEIESADIIADRLVIMGIYNPIDQYIHLLKKTNNLPIIETAYKLSQLKRSTNTINIATNQASKVVSALRNYARYQQSGEMIPAQITEGIDMVLTLYQNDMKEKLEVIRNYVELPPILCYPDELNQVWTNLINNALQAMKYEGTLTIEVTKIGQQAKISITDTGSGIPSEIQLNIFDPFFTTKPPGQGSGLGLDIVKQIIEKHQGKIEVNSVPGKTTFIVYLPIK
ncbi:MAG: response regulator [Microcoleaceae cyanobacterium]